VNKILLTGSTGFIGFIGSELLRGLSHKNIIFITLRKKIKFIQKIKIKIQDIDNLIKK
jgi:thioester reductase-like protein